MCTTSSSVPPCVGAAAGLGRDKGIQNLGSSLPMTFLQEHKKGMAAYSSHANTQGTLTHAQGIIRTTLHDACCSYSIADVLPMMAHMLRAGKAQKPRYGCQAHHHTSIRKPQQACGLRP
jgi:hypothetical protein